MGNPLYIRETLDQLSEENVLKAHLHGFLGFRALVFWVLGL